MGFTQDWYHTVERVYGSDTETTLSDGEKELIVPDYELWNVLSVWVEFITSDAGASARQLRLSISGSSMATGPADSLNSYLTITPGLTQDSALTYYYNFYPGAPDLASVRDSDVVMTPLPGNLILRPGHSINIFDVSSADTDGDDLSVFVQVQKTKILSTF